MWNEGKAGWPEGLTRSPSFLLLRFEGDDDVFCRLVTQGLHGVILLKFGRSGFEGHFLGAFLFSGFNGDGFGVNPFEFCERLTDVRLTTSSGDSCHAHRVGGRFLVVRGKAEADKQQRKDRCDDVCHFHVFFWLIV